MICNKSIEHMRIISEFQFSMSTIKWLWECNNNINICLGQHILTFVQRCCSDRQISDFHWKNAFNFTMVFLHFSFLFRWIFFFLKQIHHFFSLSSQQYFPKRCNYSDRFNSMVANYILSVHSASKQRQRQRRRLQFSNSITYRPLFWIQSNEMKWVLSFHWTEIQCFD